MKWLLFILFQFPSFSWAQIAEVLRQAPQDWSVVENVKVNGSRVILADYELIARDFPEMRLRAEENEGQWKARIHDWLLHETSYISKPQAEQQVVNNEVNHDPQDIKKAYRPKAYNRAHVIPVNGGLMDAKGVGALSPQQRHHKNGLSTLGEAIREFLYEKMVSSIMEHSGEEIHTVGSYAVIDYGFDVIHENKTHSAAGYILRQAHERSVNHNSVLDENLLWKVESVLRRYGVTSSGETQKALSFDYTNIQGTNNKGSIEIIDFGAYVVRDSFSKKVHSPYDSTFLTFGKESRLPFATPGNIDFVQPDSHIRVPMEQWGALNSADPKEDKPWVWSHELADALRSGKATPEDAQTHYQNLMNPVISRLKKTKLCKDYLQGIH